MSWSLFKRKSELARLLEGYEPYRRPFPGSSNQITLEQAQANLAYLLSNSTHRVTVLGQLMRYWKIDVHNTAEIEPLLDSMDLWAEREWPSIFERRLSDRATWHRSSRDGRDIVFSLLMDVSIFLGGLIIERAPSCSWALDLSRDSEESSMESFKRPIVLIENASFEDPLVILDFEAIVFGRYQASALPPAVNAGLFRRVVLDAIHQADSPWRNGVRV